MPGAPGLPRAALHQSLQNLHTHTRVFIVTRAVLHSRHRRASLRLVFFHATYRRDLAVAPQARFTHISDLT